MEIGKGSVNTPMEGAINGPIIFDRFGYTSLVDAHVHALWSNNELCLDIKEVTQGETPALLESIY